jgi:hypothetical protein
MQFQVKPEHMKRMAKIFSESEDNNDDDNEEEEEEKGGKFNQGLERTSDLGGFKNIAPQKKFVNPSLNNNF